MENGALAPKAIENLRAAGAWLKVNGKGIYATRPREGQLWKEGETIRFTHTKDHQTTYAFSLQWPGTVLGLKSVQPKVGSQVFLLGWSTPLPWSYSPETGRSFSSRRNCKMTPSGLASSLADSKFPRSRQFFSTVPGFTTGRTPFSGMETASCSNY